MDLLKKAAKGDHLTEIKRLLQEEPDVRRVALRYLKVLFPQFTDEECGYRVGLLAGMVGRAKRETAGVADPVLKDVAILCTLLPIFADVGMLSLAASIPTAEPVISQAEETPTRADSAGLERFFRPDGTADMLISETRDGTHCIPAVLPLAHGGRAEFMDDIREAERSIDPRAGHWTRRVVKVRRDGAEFIGKAA